MFKATFKIDGEIYPVISLDFIECKPFVVMIDRNGNFESYFNSKLNDLPHAIDFTQSLIIERGE